MVATTMLQRNRVTIGRLTARLPGGREVAPAVWRQRFGNGELHPTELPPASILLLRRERSRCSADAAGSPYRPPAEWERTVREGLAARARQAVRPNQGVLPAYAEAVLFQDEAELRACLILDLLQGWARGRWWWRRFLRGLPLTENAAAAAVCGHMPALIPAIMVQLAEWRQAARFTQRLSSSEVEDLLRGLTDAFAPPWTVPEDLPAGGAPLSADVSSPPTIGGTRSAYAEPVATPWSRAVDGVAREATLTPRQILFLGLALSLYAEPARVRTSAFGAAIGRWWAQVTPASLTPFVARPLPAGAAGAIAAAAADSVVASTTAFAVKNSARPGPREPPVPAAATDPAGATLPSSPSSRLQAEPPVDHRVGHEERQVITSSTLSGEPSPSIPAAAAADAVPEPGTRQPESAEPILQAAVDTRWGGVLYLINLLQDLDLPRCWEDPWRLVSALGPWGWLAALGRALVPTDALAVDPLWTLLLMLARCPPGEPLGAGVPEDQDYLPPATWPMDREGRDLRAAASDIRLMLWQRSGWLLADTARTDGSVDSQVASLLQRFELSGSWSRAAFAQAPLADPVPGLAPGLNGLVRRCLPFLRHELARRLGGDPEHRVESCLAQRAQVQVSSTHVDLVLSLETVDIAIRRAGLDRDPGWLPDYGRVVSFHYR